jgi:hypothetical protein
MDNSIDQRAAQLVSKRDQERREFRRLKLSEQRRKRRKHTRRHKQPVAVPLTREHIDGRSRSRRQFDAIAHGIVSDLGGELTTVEAALVEAFAGAAVTVNDLNARLMLGEAIDLSDHAAAISSLVRIASRIGTRRRARDVTPSLSEYLRGGEEAA